MRHRLFIWTLFTLYQEFAVKAVLLPCPKGFEDHQGGQCYGVLDQPNEFVKQEANCVSVNSHLPSVHNAFENGYLTQKAAGKPIWLGGKFDGSKIVWNDGTPANYEKWHAPPSKAGCIVLGENGSWTVHDCAEQLRGLCARDAIVDCLEWQQNGVAASGQFAVFVSGRTIDVFCDMQTEDGGWTMMHNRVDARQPFWNETWSTYKAGFGTPSTDANYWLGNEAIHLMTTYENEDTELYVQMWGDRQPGSNMSNAYWFTRYSNFSIGNETSNYTLYVWQNWANVQGNASGLWYDFSYSSGRPFSTIDRINDIVPECVTQYHLGGWWLYNCAFCSLNGEYVPPIKWGDGYGYFWLVEDPHWHQGEPYQYIINPTASRMLIRRKKSSFLLTNRVPTN